MKKVQMGGYLDPKAEVVKFDDKDVVRTSGIIIDLGDGETIKDSGESGDAGDAS